MGAKTHPKCLSWNECESCIDTCEQLRTFNAMAIVQGKGENAFLFSFTKAAEQSANPDLADKIRSWFVAASTSSDSNTVTDDFSVHSARKHNTLHPQKV